MKCSQVLALKPSNFQLDVDALQEYNKRGNLWLPWLTRQRKTSKSSKEYVLKKRVEKAQRDPPLEEKSIEKPTFKIETFGQHLYGLFHLTSGGSFCPVDQGQRLICKKPYLEEAAGCHPSHLDRNLSGCQKQELTRFTLAISQ